MDIHTGLQIVTLLVGIVACLIGIGATLKPTFMSDGFGISVEGKATSYVVALGIRDLFIGVVFLHLFFTGQWAAVPIYCVALGVVAVSDFLVVTFDTLIHRHLRRHVDFLVNPKPDRLTVLERLTIGSKKR